MKKKKRGSKLFRGSRLNERMSAGKHTDPVYTLKQKKKTFGTCDVSESL